MIIIAAFISNFLWAETPVIKLSIANSLKPAFSAKVDKEFEKKTGLQLAYNPAKGKPDPKYTNYSIYMMNIASGEVEAALAPVQFEEWLSVIDKEKPPLPSTKEFTSRVVGKLKFRVHAHEGVGISQLKPEQFQNLFNGSIKNWKELGGSDAPVTIVVSKDQPGINAAFLKLAIAKPDFPANSVIEPTIASAYNKVRTQAGAVTFEEIGSQSRSGITEIKGWDKGRPITLVTKGKPNERVEKLIEFLRSGIASNFEL